MIMTYHVEFLGCAVEQCTFHSTAVNLYFAGVCFVRTDFIVALQWNMQYLAKNITFCQQQWDGSYARQNWRIWGRVDPVNRTTGLLLCGQWHNCCGAEESSLPDSDWASSIQAA